MASTRGYSAVPDGFVFVPGDVSEIIGQLPADSLERVQVSAGYGVLVPGDVKLPKGLSADKTPDDQSIDALASIAPEPVIEIPDGEPAAEAPAAPDAPASA